MRNDKHFLHRVIFLLGVLVLLAVIFGARLVQLQLMDDHFTLGNATSASQTVGASATVSVGASGEADIGASGVAAAEPRQEGESTAQNGGENTNATAP